VNGRTVRREGGKRRKKKKRREEGRRRQPWMVEKASCRGPSAPRRVL